MTIQEAILDLFIACGAQELSEIVDECHRQVESRITVKDVLNALDRLSVAGTVCKEVVSTGDHQYSPSFTAWGFPSDL